MTIDALELSNDSTIKEVFASDKDFQKAVSELTRAVADVDFGHVCTSVLGDGIAIVFIERCMLQDLKKYVDRTEDGKEMLKAMINYMETNYAEESLIFRVIEG